MQSILHSLHFRCPSHRNLHLNNQKCKPQLCIFARVINDVLVIFPLTLLFLEEQQRQFFLLQNIP